MLEVLVIDRCEYCDGEAFLFADELRVKRKENDFVVLRCGRNWTRTNDLFCVREAL